MGNFNNIVSIILEADTGVPNPAASATATGAAAIGGRIKGAIGNTKLASAGRTLKTAVGASPMNMWDSPADAKNMYSLDPRGASTQVVAKLQQALQGKQPTTQSDTSSAPTEPPTEPATESFKFNVLFKTIMEAVDNSTVSDEVDAQEDERNLYIQKQVQDYITSSGFQVGQQYDFISLSGNKHTVTITAMPGDSVDGGSVAPNCVQAEFSNGSIFAVPVINSEWKYSIGPSAGQQVPAQPLDTVVPPEGDNMETSTGIKISATNPEWVKSMADMIISARSSSGGAQPLTLPSFAAGEFIFVSQKEINDYAMTQYFTVTKRGGNISSKDIRNWENGTLPDKQDKVNLLAKAKQALENKRTKNNVDLNMLHNQLKIAFKDKGLYCGTQQQFETYKKGQAAAIGSTVSKTTDILKKTFLPTHSGSTGVFA